MTEREICELIVKHGDCRGIRCYGGTETAVNYGTPCPFCECFCDDYEEQAQIWLDDHNEKVEPSKPAISKLKRSILIDSDIQTLVEVMKEKLAENDHKVPWYDIPNRELFGLLDDEVSELSHAIKHGTPREIMRECADVGNLAMMIAGNEGRKIV